MNTKGVPLWQKNFQLFSESYPIIQLTTNIEDLMAYKNSLGTSFSYVTLDEWIWKYYSAQNSTVVVFYSSISGFSNRFSAEHLNEFNSLGGSGNADEFSVAIQRIINAFQASNDKKVVVVFDQSLRWLTAGPIIQPNDQRAFTALKTSVINNAGVQRHQLIFINEKGADLPGFMLATQSHAKSIIISKPDQIQRSNYLEYLFANRNFTQSQLYSVAQRAEGLTLNEIRTALRTVDYANCSPNDLINQISLFQFGFSEDPWAQIDEAKVDEAEEILGRYVFGQPEAIRYSAEMIQYAASGFASVMQDDGRTAPKGVMFFCGLSGTGKTELAKAIARLVFGSADAMIRFDMGEYNQPHSAERLTGAPPGYVGHDAGGQLTEAIKAHPFCLLLFDEIEKADPTVMNKFLSILEDGRLTDGKGETVSFENTIIIFTSNLGAARASQETDSERIREIIAGEVKNYCEQQPPIGIGKPELYSRLAGNIVVFNPLDENSIHRIFDNYYEQSIKKISEQMNIRVTCADSFVDKLRSLTDEVHSNGEFPGGRGMKKAMDKYFLIPLSSFKQRNKCNEGDSITLTDFVLQNNVVELVGSVQHRTHNTNTTQDRAEREAEPHRITIGAKANTNSQHQASSGFKVKKRT